MKAEQENCTVTVRGVQVVEGEEDTVELVTGGRFTSHGGRWLIRYEESDATGYGGCRTTLRVDPQKGEVVLLRTGAVHSQLVVEEGRRHQCTYDTGYGNLVLGVNGSRVHAQLTPEGGQLEFHYSLDVNTALISENAVYVTVLPR